MIQSKVLVAPWLASLALLTGGFAVGGQEPEKEQETPKATPKGKARQPSYVPNPSAPIVAGDRAVTAERGNLPLVNGYVDAAYDLATFAALGHYLTPPVQGGPIAELQLQKRVVALPGYNLVEVVRIIPASTFGPQVGDAAEIRVLTGPLKDRPLFVRKFDLVKMVERIGKTRPDVQAKEINPSARAEGLLKSAQSLDKSGKTPGALGLYRLIAKDFPGTPQAQTAANRIKALSEK